MNCSASSTASPTPTASGSAQNTARPQLTCPNFCRDSAPAAVAAVPFSSSESTRHSMTLHDSGAPSIAGDAEADSVAKLFDQQHHERYGTILADPPWQFMNRTGKMAPEHRRLNRYAT